MQLCTTWNEDTTKRVNVNGTSEFVENRREKDLKATKRREVEEGWRWNVIRHSRPFSWTSQFNPLPSAQCRSHLFKSQAFFFFLPAGGALTLCDVMNKFEVLGIVGEGRWFSLFLSLSYVCPLFTHQTFACCTTYQWNSDHITLIKSLVGMYVF